MRPHRALIGQRKRIGADLSGLEQSNSVPALDGTGDEVEMGCDIAAKRGREVGAVVEVVADAADLAGTNERRQCLVHRTPVAAVCEVHGCTDPFTSREGPDAGFDGIGDGVHDWRVWQPLDVRRRLYFRAPAWPHVNPVGEWLS